jgi:hypothetical protein
MLWKMAINPLEGIPSDIIIDISSFMKSAIILNWKAFISPTKARFLFSVMRK